MRWWKGANSSSSSSSSPKSVIESPVSPYSKQRRALRDVNFFRSRREAASQPRLTRQRKLRHLTDLEIEGLAVNDRDSSKPSVSENSTPLSRSPSNRKSSSERPSAVVPLPLPLPDLSALSRREPGFSGSNSGRFILPSPTEVVSWSREEGDGTEILNGDPVRERTPSPIGRRFSYQISHKGPENVGQSSARSAVDHGANTVESILCFRHSVPAKSAPSSSFSSPVRSPRRLSSGDCFPSYMGSPGLQFRSVPELPSPDVTSSGFSSNTSPEKFTGPSSEWSPLHSPTRRNVGPKSGNPSGSSTPLQPRISIESSSAWHDNGLLTVHPLPLPPGASVPSQPAFVHHGPVKSELSSMTSQWQKGKLIGSGTFGNVYVATNRETGALCAMKEVNLIPDDPKSAESMQQLEQEIKVLSQLKHPNIVQYYGSEIVEDRFYIYLEYVHPGSISKYVREHCGAMTESVVRNFTRHILSGLAYLHNTKTIHRDIKGANLLVDASGVVKLADFGMAKHLSGQAAVLSLKGSPYWMAPEVIQAMMHKEVGYDLAVDIWSLGCTIIEMLTGKAPWSEFEGAAAMFKVLRNECPPIPETLSPEGKDFLQCCFKRNPAERPSASKLLEHRFLKNFSQTHEISGCIQAVSQMKFMDMMQSPRDRSSLVQTSEGNHLPECEIGQSQPETSECAAGMHHSPRSTLEAIPSPSPPHSNYLSRSSAPSKIRVSFGSLGKQQSY